MVALDVPTMPVRQNRPDVGPHGAIMQHLNPSDVTASQAWSQDLSPGTSATQASPSSQDVFNPVSKILNASMIPGLGLSFSNESVHGRDQGTARFDAKRFKSESTKQQAMDTAVNSAIVDPTNSATTTRFEGKAQDDDELEEGEVSEGEGEVQNSIEFTAVQNHGPHQSNSRSLGSPDVAMAEIHPICPQAMSAASPAFPTNLGACGGSSQITDVARERSASYSPCLSPGELTVDSKRNQAVEGNAPKLYAKLPEAYSLFKELKSQTISQRKSTAGIRKPQQADKRKSINQRRSQSFIAARKKALDAILKLMPINVQYQTFVAEGIDREVLDSLFEDLGLPKNTSAQGPTSLAPANRVSLASHKIPPNNSASNIHRQSTPADQISSAGVEVRDKTEERKDRIIRLLAAKNQRPNILVNPSQNKASTAIEANEQSHAARSKKITEKSVLLREKMNALAKSRQDSQEPAGTKPKAKEASANKVKVLAAKDITPKTFLSKPIDCTRSDSSAAVKEHQDLVETTSSPLISRPSSSNDFRISDALRSASQPCRPGQVHAFHSKSNARSFAQNFSVRPFLIQVGDEEEDESEEINSEIEHQSDEKMGTRAQWQGKDKGDARREVGGLKHQPADVSQLVASRQKMSPKFLVSNPASRSSSSLTLRAAGKGSNESSWELENMNKEIEAMKRKIAEAQARHRSKLSRQASSAKRQEDDSCPESFRVNMSLSEDARSMSPVRNSTSYRASPTSLNSRLQSREQDSRSVSNLSDTLLSERRNRSRAASERLPAPEARRKQQNLKLRALQFQIANIQREIEGNIIEEERLKKELASFEQESNTVAPLSGRIPGSERVAAECAEGRRAADVSSSHAIKVSKNLTSFVELGRDLQLSTPAQGQFSNDIHATQPGSGAPVKDLPSINHSDTIAAGGPNPISPKQALLSPDDTTHDTVMIDVDSSLGAIPALHLGKADAQNAAIFEQSSEPAQLPLPGDIAQATEQLTNIEGLSRRDSSTNLRKSIVTLDDSRSTENGREVSISPNSSSHFVPYESPLQYFRAYRFHPQYQNAVSGGLRSLTYSNKIDVKRELCPFELARQPCSDGTACEYQHFADMKAPDDQILVQLGAAGSYEREQKQEYISGLRHLLTDFRRRKVKDFQTISQAIVEYRGRFRGDRSKILPLDGVSI